MVLRKLFGLFSRTARAKDIPEVTEYLAKNEAFKKAALGVHRNKKNFFTNLDQYLEKELLGKEPAQRIGDRSDKPDRYK